MPTLYTEPVNPPNATWHTGHGQPLTDRECDRNAADMFRRHVAVLFADITGFTRLVETVDPEVVYHRVGPLLNDLALHVHRCHGEIQQVLGDGFMAVFGLRFTRGDEAERAVRAGHAMLGVGGSEPACLDIHVGIEFGEVLVTHSRDPAAFGVWGHAVNVARRLCEVAAPAQVVVGAAAINRCRHQVDSSAVRLHLRGITRPVTAHRLGRPEIV